MCAARLPFRYSLLVVLLLAIVPTAQGQTLLKKLEEKFKAAVAPPEVPAAEKDAELPAPAPAADGPRPGYLGLAGENDKAGGVKVTELLAPGKAKEAGLKVGDRIVAVDAAKIENDDEMGALLTEKKPGDKVVLTVVRGDEEQEITVTLVEPPAIPAEAPAEAAVEPAPPLGGPVVTPRLAAAAGKASLGITVVPLTEEERNRLGVTVRRGALISAIRPGSPADLAGLPLGGVIVALDGKMIQSSEELVALIRDAHPGQEVELTYYQGAKLFRKSVKLAPAATISTLPRGYGSEPPTAIGPPGAERPLLSRVEKVVEGLTRPGAAPAPAIDAADVAAMQQHISNMQAQMKLLVDRVDALEAKVAELEAAAAAAAKPAEEAPPKAELPEPSIPKPAIPKPATPKLNSPEKAKG